MGRMPRPFISHQRIRLRKQSSNPLNIRGNSLCLIPNALRAPHGGEILFNRPTGLGKPYTGSNQSTLPEGP